MAWSQPGTRPSGITVQSTTNKDDMTHIRIIHWFFEQYIYNRQAWLLETRIIGRAFIQILIMMILITETYKTVRHYLMAWLPKPSRAGGQGSCRYCNEMTYIILTTKIPTDLWILMSKLLPIFHFSDAVCKIMFTPIRKYLTIIQTLSTINHVIIFQSQVCVLQQHYSLVVF